MLLFLPRCLIFHLTTYDHENTRPKRRDTRHDTRHTKHTRNSTHTTHARTHTRHTHTHTYTHMQLGQYGRFLARVNNMTSEAKIALLQSIYYNPRSACMGPARILRALVGQTVHGLYKVGQMCFVSGILSELCRMAASAVHSYCLILQQQKDQQVCRGVYVCVCVRVALYV